MQKKDRLKIIPDTDIKFSQKRNVIKSFKKGYSLIELSRGFHIDFSLILHIIRHAKITRKQLYIIYERQIEQQENTSVVCIPKKEKIHIEKFFPMHNDDFTNSYYMFWKQKYDKQQYKKKICKHPISHIQCSVCGKILDDASKYIKISKKPILSIDNSQQKK